MGIPFDGNTVYSLRFADDKRNNNNNNNKYYYYRFGAFYKCPSCVNPVRWILLPRSKVIYAYCYYFLLLSKFTICLQVYKVVSK